MANCRFLLFLGILLINGNVFAQQINIVDATWQSWSGGIAGHSGDNYHFIVEFSKYKKEPIPEKIWIDGIGTQLLLSTAQEPGNMKKTNDPKSRKVTYNITISTSNWKMKLPHPYEDTTSENVSNVPPIKYSGVALLQYHHFKGKNKYYTIKSYKTIFPAVNYP